MWLLITHHIYYIPIFCCLGLTFKGCFLFQFVFLSGKMLYTLACHPWEISQVAPQLIVCWKGGVEGKWQSGSEWSLIRLWHESNETSANTVGRWQRLCVFVCVWCMPASFHFQLWGRLVSPSSSTSSFHLFTLPRPHPQSFSTAVLRSFYLCLYLSFLLIPSDLFSLGWLDLICTATCWIWRATEQILNERFWGILYFWEQNVFWFCENCVQSFYWWIKPAVWLSAWEMAVIIKL